MEDLVSHPSFTIMNSIGLSSANMLGRRQFLRGTAAALAMPFLAGRAIAGPAAPAWRMRLAFSSVMLAELPIEEVCARAAQLGFEAIDIWCPFGNCKHLTDVVARLGPGGLKELLARHKLALASFTTYCTGAEAVGFPAYADFIGKFGGGVVVRESEYTKVKPGNLTAAMRAFFEKLKPQIEKAAETKVRLAIENHGDALLDTLDSFKAFVDLNPSPQQVGLGVAPYHLQNIKAPVAEVIRTAGSQLLFFYAWQAAGGMKQLPGHGPADFVPWLKALAEIRYAGFVNPFLHGDPTPEDLSAGMTKACAYLKDCHRQATA
jgi:sugar phosphate isomerase/epimerase